MINLPSSYTWDTARRDLVAGATVAAIAIPQAMAYALIAGVDPRFGLYSAIINTLIASILGSSSHLINGPTNAISLVVFGALASFDERFSSYQAMFLLAIIAGAIQIFIATFRLGNLTRYVSESVILGFMAGAGILIAIDQVGNFLGVPRKGTGAQSVPVQFWETLTQGWPYNLHAIGLGLATLVLVLLLRRIVNRHGLPKMEMLLGLILVSLFAAWFHWSIPAADGSSVVPVVGKVPAALPTFHIPEIDFRWILQLFSSALAISLLGLLEALSVAKSIAAYTRQPLDYNRQCLAEGVSNLVGGFFQSLPGSGSLTRSSINYQAGGLTRMSGIYSALIVAVAVLAFGPCTRFIPKAALAALLFITAARLIDWKRLGYAMRATRFDAILVLVTALSAIFISVDGSILIGVALSFLLFIPRASKLSMRELIVTPEHVVRERLPDDPPPDSVFIFDLEGDLFFGAASSLDRHLAQIRKAAETSGIKHVVLRLRRTRNPDVVSIERLERFLREMQQIGIVILLAGVRPDFARTLNKMDFSSWLPPDRIFPEEEKKYSATLHAIRHACELRRNRTDSAPPGENPDATYYLV